MRSYRRFLAETFEISYLSSQVLIFSLTAAVNSRTTQITLEMLKELLECRHVSVVTCKKLWEGIGLPKTEYVSYLLKIVF
jgi:hypothetical protein